MAGYKGPYKGAFKQGAKGLDCAAVKRCLKRRQHNNSIKSSRTFGKAATQALRDFQKNQKLSVDGVFGPATFKKMAPMMRGYEVFLYRRAKSRTNTVKVWAIKAPGADRPGVPMKDYVQEFIAKAAKIYGHPVIIGTGTNHNQYVAGSNRQSAHWTGDAGDVPLYGKSLTKFGRACLVAAGMPAWKAAFCRGGVYNVGGWNILFNTTVGGNHWNHTHAGH
jgi:peptidoglycan hydrolase-like protein with peptidoglycan-binding domain